MLHLKFGVGVTLSQSVQVTRPRGTVVIVSIFAHAVDFDPMLLTNSGVQLTSTIAYSLLHSNKQLI